MCDFPSHFLGSRHCWDLNLLPSRMTESIVCCCLVSQLCLTLLQPHELYAASFPVHGISQARKLEWVAISFFR